MGIIGFCRLVGCDAVDPQTTFAQPKSCLVFFTYFIGRLFRDSFTILLAVAEKYHPSHNWFDLNWFDYLYFAFHHIQSPQIL